MKLKQRILKTSILVWMLLVLVACAPTTGDLAQPVDDGGVDEDVAETAVPPTEQPSETTGDWLDITWILQSYAGQLALPDKMVTAEFMADGQLVGIGGCNNYFGSYQLDGNAISIAGVGSTEMWCEGAMDQEAAFLGMLLQAESWALADGTLTINTAAGELVFGEAAVSDESGATQAAGDGVGNTAVSRICFMGTHNVIRLFFFVFFIKHRYSAADTHNIRWTDILNDLCPTQRIF